MEIEMRASTYSSERFESVVVGDEDGGENGRPFEVENQVWIDLMVNCWEEGWCREVRSHNVGGPIQGN